MPRGEMFWNPYRMVPLRPEVRRSAPVTWERFAPGLKSGTVFCSFINLTPLRIGIKSFRRGTSPVIPGSSLKGVLRSLAEVVGGGCCVIQRHADSVHQACNNQRNICITCNMFGMMERGRNAKVLKGKVQVGDAHITGDKAPVFEAQKVYLGSPKESHEAFYINPANGRLDWAVRKFYFHQPAHTKTLMAPTGKALESAWTIDTLSPGHTFAFEAAFQNFSTEELSLLLYVLALEEDVRVTIEGEGNPIALCGPLCHKIGYAKCLGGGSCRIRIEKIVLYPNSFQRYSSITTPHQTVLEGEELNSKIREWTGEYVEDQSATMTQLRKMLVWDEKDPRNFHYPQYSWFKNGTKTNVPLKPI